MMQRCASPDITEGVPPPLPPSERKVGRPKRTLTPSNPVDRDSQSPVETPDANATQAVRRGRGRPKKNVETVLSPVTTAAAVVQNSPPIVQATTPKRRGRKPRSLKDAAASEPEGTLGDVLEPSSDAVPLASQSQSLGHTSEVKEDIEPMETTDVPETSFFSSILKSEVPFGQQVGGGIPGLDLNDYDPNNSLFSSEHTRPQSFLFGPVPTAPDDECNKSLQLLQINKMEMTLSKSPVETDSIKKEEPQNDENESSKVRRSSRIKTLEEQRGPRGRRREVVPSLSESTGLSRSTLSLNEEDSNSNSSLNLQSSGTTSGYSSPSRENYIVGSIVSSSCIPNFHNMPPNTLGMGAGSNNSSKPLKVKSRWRHSVDADTAKSGNIAGEHDLPNFEHIVSSAVDAFKPPTNLTYRPGRLAFDGSDPEILEKLKKFDGIDESIYRTERKISKENKGMVCDCYLSNEDVARGESGCSEDCLNRLLMVECGHRCPTGEHCSNRRFQKKEYAMLNVFKTEKKGHGLRTLQHIPEGGFVIEYVGEVLDVVEFERRTNEYAKGNQEHFYFMALKSDAIIDATVRGNCSRFINHSCEPNCETQKWTVNGEVRIGFFAITDLHPGDEITFDYQFQRYGKKAQKCYCMTESCRGWIGEEDDDVEIQEGKEETVAEAETEVEDSKVKVKPKAEKKKRKNVQLEDMAFREELLKLEGSGLKNRNHTLTLSRLMVRAEGWDDRERLLKILINGDTPCRRLFLDYHGLRLIWSWMVDLPLPHETDGPQLIRNDVYHMLFLQALQSLPIPNRNLLLESKVLSLTEKWCSAPSITTTVTLVKRTDVAPEVKKGDQENLTASPDIIKACCDVEKMDTSDIKEEPTSTADGMQEIVDNRSWNFVSIAKSLLESWCDLKEVFRIPKKERVEQMKEHEREADKGLLNATSTNQLPTAGPSNSYDRNPRNKPYRPRGERRVPVLDPTQNQFHRFPNRMIVPPGVTKEQWRKNFEQTVKEREEQEQLRQQQDSLVNLHQERCALVGLDPATTPIVDPHGVHYLDPKTVMWKAINIDDPTMPTELIKFVTLSQYPPASEPIEVPAPPPVEPEQAFPPWPPGLPPPPPLPPRDLPKNWNIAVDDEGRCYYYHSHNRVPRWEPPAMDEASSSESSGSSSEEEVVEETVGEDGSPSITKSSIQTWRTKLIERAEKRKKTGLVEERIISPRGDDDKGFSKEMVKENKKKALEEKLARLAVKDEISDVENLLNLNTSGEAVPSGDVQGKSKAPTESQSVTPDSVAHKMNAMKKKRKESKHVEHKHGPKPSPKSKPKPSTSRPEKNLTSSSPIETELDLTLSQQSLDEDDDAYGNRVTAGPSRIIGSTPSMDVIIPGLGLDSRDLKAMKELDAKKKAERMARHVAKKKAMMQKSKVKEKPAADGSDTRISSKEASTIKDAFRNSIATVVVSHLNPYRKGEQIKNTEDFKHLARKITHAILLKELKHTRNIQSLEVTDSVRHKTKEYIKKFMARFPNSVYIRSPENTQGK